MSLGRWIQRARVNRGLTQWQLAVLVATSQSMISRWERDRRRPANLELEGLEKELRSPLRALAYANDELPSIIDGMLAAGEARDGGHIRLSKHLAIRTDGVLVAAPMFLNLLRSSAGAHDMARNWLSACATPDGTRLPPVSGDIPAAVASALYQDSLVPLMPVAMNDDYCTNPVPRAVAPESEGSGILARLSTAKVSRPLWPSSYHVESGRKITFGHSIPTASPAFRGKRIDRAEDILEDPLHAVLVQLAILRLFPSVETSASILVVDRAVLLRLQSQTWEWEGALFGALQRILSVACLQPVESRALPVPWDDALHIALENLARLRVLAFNGPRVDAAVPFVSAVSASPSHPANRAEKTFRERLRVELPLLFANQEVA